MKPTYGEYSEVKETCSKNERGRQLRRPRQDKKQKHERRAAEYDRSLGALDSFGAHFTWPRAKVFPSAWQLMRCTILTSGAAKRTICPVAPKAIRRLILKVRK
jgi:hypothetical protein